MAEKDKKPSIRDLAYRAVAGVIGGPVDLATMAMRPFGYNVEDKNVVGGSEWIGGKMEKAGLVSSARSPLKEFLASMISPSGLAKGAASSAMFIGPLARTWRSADATKLEEMEKAGGLVPYSTRAWQETGTIRGPEGLLRQEISDNTAVLKPVSPGTPYAGLGDILEHPELYQAYPDLKDIAVHFPTKGGRISGSYHPDTDIIKIFPSYSPEDMKSTLLHEIQHAIQKREGFARGGMPSEFAGDKEIWARDADNIRRRANHLLSAANIKNMMRQRGITADEAAKAIYGSPLSDLDPNVASYVNSNANPEKLIQSGNEYRKVAAEREMIGTIGPFESYRRLAGEAEARLTQNRRTFDDQDRFSRLPVTDMDVDPATLIVRRWGED